MGYKNFTIGYNSSTLTGLNDNDWTKKIVNYLSSIEGKGGTYEGHLLNYKSYALFVSLV